MSSLSTPGLHGSASRADTLSRLAAGQRFDILVIGGGATGLGVALEAASRGHAVALVEARDFAQGTSSRATKLVHGGVRYLAQGDVSLVREALHERQRLLCNAPHLARPLAFVLPSYRLWERPVYGLGLLAYDLLAGRARLGRTRWLGRAATRDLLPGVKPEGLRGGLLYWDGQFDDARLAVALARTAASHGALVCNHCRAVSLIHEDGRAVGAECEDTETGHRFAIHARVVVNATGVWVDEVRHMDAEAVGRDPEPMVSPSQGVHLVVDREFLPSNHALLVPRTRDGRVLFAVPWLGKVILGTTDTPRPDLALEPRPFAEEVRFVLEESARYLARAPARSDVRSAWVGLRPLVAPPKARAGEEPRSTKGLSRAHTIVVSAQGLVSVTGGKWTIYRAMGEEVVDRCERLLEPAGRESEGAHGQGFGHGRARASAVSPTIALRLLGADGSQAGTLHGCGGVPSRNTSADHLIAHLEGSHLVRPPGMELYGNEAPDVLALPGAGRNLLAECGLPSTRWRDAGRLTEAMVRHAVREEYARSVEDVLARRSRLLFLDAELAAAVAPLVAPIVKEESGRDPRLQEFLALCAQYRELPLG